MRSYLFIPGDSEKKMAKGLESGADCLFLDLEDSVAAPSKDAARKIVCAFLSSARMQPHAPKLYVRVNALDSGLTDADLAGVMAGHPDGILLPKSQNGADVQHLASKLAVHEAEVGLSDGSTRIICVATETASAVFGLSSYRGSSPRLAGLTWGAEDLSADLGAETNRLSDGSHAAPYALARTLTLLAAVSAEVQPVDTVYPSFRDDKGFRAECVAARRDGFTGKMAVHPAQVPIINEIFTPPASEILRAQKIINAFAADPTAGVIGIDGEMLDKPHLERAKKLLSRVKQV